MKVLLITLLVALSSINAIAHDFKVDKNKLIWQKIEESELSVSDIATALRKGGKANNVEINGNTITATFKDIMPNYTAAGKKRGMVPIFLLSDSWSGSIVIEVKDKKHRVTISNLLLTTIVNGGLLKKGEMREAELFLLTRKRDKIKPILENNADILEATFKEILNDDAKQYDNW